MNEPIFRLSRVTKLFDDNAAPVLALDGVDLDVARGSFLGIVGTSGAGKSTLLRVLNLLDTPSSGTIEFNGRNLAELNAKGQREYLSKVATIFQHFNLFHGKTVFDNITFPLAIRGVPFKERAERARALINRVGLEGREGHYPSQLSGGQKQRVGIARALITRPEVLLCDEATSALDSQTTQTILDLLAELKQLYGFTVILITHSWEVIRYACDAAVLLEHGKVTEAGLLREVIQRERSVLKDHILPLNGDAAWQKGPDTLDLIFENPETQTDLLAKVANALSMDFSILSGRVDNVGKRPIARFKVRFRPRHPPAMVDVEQVKRLLAEAMSAVTL
ncbi:methionine ABC transporter ATP-binding protein [Pseudomonas typographi]|uniref:ATP-binding cassette domain-containing protein n=1 Tax=Pseudomonas typographi TaxID=2715964 RepID=A0ABR7YZV5_9PSED|nr:ATP-binding cassette domain-containing protein [Pseudomonas typographi]MBD1550579.1 ATP-binding cassette domain-containing protein [Pseudomonas typographi]MBD1586836.1 ATP-binding cassette domain-containing protein [Pseudomonas typographi]MBD1598730.1 ATP-binding cassette domain-containing protein [Pseudomonas typographi]